MKMMDISSTEIMPEHYADKEVSFSTPGYMDGDEATIYKANGRQNSWK
jgi:hypothetical protein